MISERNIKAEKISSHCNVLILMEYSQNSMTAIYNIVIYNILSKLCFFQAISSFTTPVFQPFPTILMKYREVVVPYKTTRVELPLMTGQNGSKAFSAFV